MSRFKSMVRGAFAVGFTISVLVLVFGRDRLVSLLDRPSHPFIVMVSIDTLHVNWTGLYNRAVRNTPFLDRFRDQGTVWEHAYTQVPITLPSHTALMTGVAPSRLGVMRNGDVVPQGVTTLAEVFQDAGYRTSAFVSLGVLSETYGLNQGFTDYHDPFAGDSARWYRHADEVLEPVEDWLDKHGSDPFFMWVHLSDPHEPYLEVNALADTRLELDSELVGEFSMVSKKIHRAQVSIPPGRHRLKWRSLRAPTPEDRPETAIYLQLHSRDKLDRFTDAELPSGDEFIALVDGYQISLDNPSSEPKTVELAFSGGLVRPAPADVLDDYAMEVGYVDRHLVRLEKAFREQGIDEEILWLIVSDHGEGLFRHDRLGHAGISFEDQLRVLWLMKGPSIPRRHSVEAPALLNDVAPTLLDIVSLDKPRMDGRTQVDCLEADPAGCTGRKSWWAFGLSHETNGLTSMAGYQWPHKWVWFRGKPRLGFHVVDDPWEEVDLLSDPGPHNPEPLKLLAEQFRDERRRLRNRLQNTAPTYAPGEDDPQRRLLRSLGYLGAR